MADLRLEDLIACYARGTFPMADARDDPRLYLVDPPLRGVIPLGAFHVPARLRRTVRRAPYDIKIDTAFEGVVQACAEPAANRPVTWINRPLEAFYRAMFARGLAHSVEAWRGDDLVGGLFGISLGGAFFGESMFSRADDASKIALVHLVARLRVGGYRLLDAQFMNDHLVQFGAVETPRADYLEQLRAALDIAPDFYLLAPSVDGSGVLQATSHAS